MSDGTFDGTYDGPAVLTVAVPLQERRATDVAGRAADPLALLEAADADADAFADRLHDGVLQALVVARYAADAAVRGGSPAAARDAVQEALVALRRAVWLLRPRGSDDLPTALAELSGQMVAAGDPPLDLDVDPLVAAALTPVARGAAYRFVQALATGDATTSVRLSLHTTTLRGGTALLAVTGSVPDPAGWAARAAALDGRLEPDATTARLLLPLRHCDLEGDR